MIEMPDMLAAGPEIALAVIGMVLMMIGVFAPEKKALSIVSGLTIASLIVTLAFVIWLADGRVVAFSGLFLTDAFAVYMKILVLLGSIFVLFMSENYVQREGMDRFEFPILVIYATVGMMMMISANDLISLYVGLELQSLSLYVIAAFQRDRVRSSEAGLKYFVLGALSSGLLLYGCSLIYGFAGTTNFDALAGLFAGQGLEASPGLIVGMVFLTAGLAFKISAVPFHMWTPDVYEGAPTAVTAFFAVAPKIAAIALFLRVMLEPFGGLIDEWRQIIVLISIASMVLGAFAAIAQNNIKRLMAYSSIGHVGYALIGLASGSEAGLRGVLIYMAIYLVMNVGAFACILCMRVNGRMVENIDDLAGSAKSHPMMALAILIFMFSLAGIPPMAGFFGKFFIFTAAIEAELYTLAIIGVVASVVGAYYYLRIVKIVFFDDLTERFDKPIGRSLSTVMTLSGVVTILFFLWPAPILDSAAVAAAALFPG
ncbi:MAG: NADH-quinone oxidoreductase subunit NuoN [Alphaproteobacteria bacterium]|nr:NADH-quinone oxidoreductase subunit NuoN [Alphaproteobacteria bacterium]